ncbi:alcohol dehydrogenase 2-like [Sitodiplosis mosellana]|uniref:alcohol dehydrogenase 2-like n=1 Tax=Sitodiplosis mosellana TaxID=263140 RepID=UPI0024441927|nr:alcohol dehydrogenase 2-like [Sitodiplosis mosellana]XP_055324745.1 alcohol dehydrogenase 2-like [Sitodiplosis mosellana]XP_055324746.1 alcohol dehydrogenase 2-like [Sitodiplosis mosellana]
MKDGSCIVIGGAGGMGVQICRKLLENDIANLAIVDIQTKPVDLLDKLKTQNPTTRIVYFECDISVKDELESTFQSIADMFKQVGILINAAGTFNDKDVQLTFKVNVFGMIYSTMLGMEIMSKEKRNGSTDAVIVNIASLVGLDPFHLLPIYTASKHAIVGFSRAYSHECYSGRSGVKIVVLCPGATTTSFVRQFSGNMIVPDEIDALNFFRSVPMQSSERVAEHTIELIKTAENGTVWLSDNGSLTKITMTTYGKYN